MLCWRTDSLRSLYVSPTNISSTCLFGTMWTAAASVEMSHKASLRSTVRATGTCSAIAAGVHQVGGGFVWWFYGKSSMSEGSLTGSIKSCAFTSNANAVALAV